jgi:hypothetical protein
MHGIKVLMARNYFDNLSEKGRKGLELLPPREVRRPVLNWYALRSPTVTRPQP